MTSSGRRIALCSQVIRNLTGIDFVQVVDPADQRKLRVFFVIEPTLTVPPMLLPAQVPPLAAGVNQGPIVAVAAPLTVQIQTVAEGRSAQIVALGWRRVRTVIDTRVALEVDVLEPGGFEPYSLILSHPHLDPLSATIIFDFKQGCETGFDCAVTDACPSDTLIDVDIDYLARDFDSLRRALLDFTALRYPNWKEQVEADFGVMMFEGMAAIGDHFAYQQDRNDAETRFASATQRASLAAMTKLVDYRPFRGQAAQGPVVFTASAGGTIPIDSRIWGEADPSTSVVFSTVSPLWVHPFWNRLAAHNPDSTRECIGHGATSLMLVSSAAVAAQTPAGVTRAEFLVGKTVMILSDPASAAWPKRAIEVTITAFEEFSDPLVQTSGLPTFVTKIYWDTPTEVELPFDGLNVAFNVVDAGAGEVVVEHFRIGDVSDIAAHYGALDPVVEARMASLPSAIERDGPLERTSAGRDIIFRYGLTATEEGSLRHLESGLPDVIVEEVTPGILPVVLPVDDADLFGLFLPDPGADDWAYLDDLLSGDLDTNSFTVEPGMWRVVKRHQLRFGSFAFRDYAANGGWTLRFGSGDFGKAPSDGAVVRVTYRTDPGIIANLPSEALSLRPPAGQVLEPTLAALVTNVMNPLPFYNAATPETVQSIKVAAPQAFKVNPRRAVRPEDYEAILGKLPFVQRANAVTLWTGSWLTDFVAVDPKNAVKLTDPQRHLVEQELDCIRLATRDVRRLEAEYLDIDIDISVCVATGAYAGEVIKAIKMAIAAPGFFDPDNFTFGTPLIRSALEAAVQAVSGVRFVDAIRIRVRSLGDWRDFNESELVPAPNQIIRLQDDPNRAALGILRIHSDRVAKAGV